MELTVFLAQQPSGASESALDFSSRKPATQQCMMAMQMPLGKGNHVRRCHNTVRGGPTLSSLKVMSSVWMDFARSPLAAAEQP